MVSFSIRALLLCFATDPKMAKCTVWVYKRNYELPIKNVARSVQHFISADCAEADSVPLWTQSTGFWKHHQALGSHSSNDGREVTCMTRFLQWKWRNWAFGKFCQKWICTNDILALKKKKSSHSQTFLGIHSLAGTDVIKICRTWGRRVYYWNSEHLNRPKRRNSYEMNKFFDPKIPLAGIWEKKIRVKIKDISIFTTALLISKNKH